MGLAWQQGPLAQGAIGHFLGHDPLPGRLLFVEPLRRRMRVRFGALEPSEHTTRHADLGATWSYADAWPEVRRISGLVSFEPDKVEVHLDGTRLRLEPGQTVIPHGIDRNLDLDEAPSRQT
ncbi:MAG: hypothetical protein ACRDS0_13450 [Pseudonocardiaceae bacterium]